MSRLLAVLLASVVVTLTGCSKKSDQFITYEPKVGDTWVTVDISSRYPFECISAITKVEHKDDALFVTIEMTTTLGVWKRRVIQMTDAGVLLVESDDIHFDPPKSLMPRPLKEGDSWEWEKPGIEKWKFHAVREEEVSVPAGKFKALRIEGEGTLQKTEWKPARSMTCTEWIVSGLPTMRCVISGLPIIKNIITIGDGSEDIDGEMIEVLKSFTPGEK